MSREDIRWIGFVGTYLGAGIGLLIFIFDSLSGLY
jgi:hypothetical protein